MKKVLMPQGSYENWFFLIRISTVVSDYDDKKQMPLTQLDHCR